MAFYLVTGGGGFIGSNIVSELVKQGGWVRVLDNFATGKRENLLPLEAEIELIEGDLRDHETVRRAVEGIEYVLHQGALPSVPRSITAPMTTNEVNVTGTLNLLIAARYAGVKRVVYASSSSVYGETEALPKREDMATRPLSPYGVSKLAAEQYCRVFWKVYGLETVVLRYFNVFGPHQDPKSQYAAVIPRFITAILQGERPVIYGDGQQSVISLTWQMWFRRIYWRQLVQELLGEYSTSPLAKTTLSWNSRPTFNPCWARTLIPPLLPLVRVISSILGPISQGRVTGWVIR